MHDVPFYENDRVYCPLGATERSNLEKIATLPNEIVERRGYLLKRAKNSNVNIIWSRSTSSRKRSEFSVIRPRWDIHTPLWFVEITRLELFRPLEKNRDAVIGRAPESRGVVVPWPWPLESNGLRKLSYQEGGALVTSRWSNRARKLTTEYRELLTVSILRNIPETTEKCRPLVQSKNN